MALLTEAEAFSLYLQSLCGGALYRGVPLGEIVRLLRETAELLPLVRSADLPAVYRRLEEIVDEAELDR